MQWSIYFLTKKLNHSQVQVHFLYRKPQVAATVNFRDPARRLLRRPCLAWRTRLIIIFNLLFPKHKSRHRDELIFE